MTGFWDGSGISWTICKQSAPHSRQISTPTPRHSIFTGRMLFLTPKQQCQKLQKRDQKTRTTKTRTRSLEENLANLGSSLISRRTSRQLMVMRSTALTNSSMEWRNRARLRRVNAATCSANRRCLSALSSSLVSCHR